ncbi:MAG: PilZ domain-containing protein [Sphingomicrobium sp.]
MNSIREQILGGERPERRSLLSPKRKKGANGDAGLTSVEIQREAVRQTNTRGGDRHRLLPDQHTRVTHKRKSYVVHLINLSGGGAMISADFEPLMWDRVDLHLGGESRTECAVRWIKDGRIGLEFAHETRLDCSEDEQAEVLRAVIAENFAELALEPADFPVDAPRERKRPDKRASRRHPLIWSGVLRFGVTTAPVRLRNVSSTGAQAEINGGPSVGEGVVLDLGNSGSIAATVSWAVGDHIGLSFNEPFDLARLARSKPEIAPVKWNQPHYLKVDPTAARADQSPWSEEWGRMSLDELREELEGFLKH